MIKVIIRKFAALHSQTVILRNYDFLRALKSLGLNALIKFPEIFKFMLLILNKDRFKQTVAVKSGMSDAQWYLQYKEFVKLTSNMKIL